MHGANYRRSNGQPYTRKKYIKGKPQSKIAKFHGGKKGSYDYGALRAACVKLPGTPSIRVLPIGRDLPAA